MVSDVGETAVAVTAEMIGGAVCVVKVELDEVPVAFWAFVDATSKS
jgi:hypothetical protein